MLTGRQGHCCGLTSLSDLTVEAAVAGGQSLKTGRLLFGVVTVVEDIVELN